MHTELKKNFLERRLDIHAMHTEIKNLCLVYVVEKKFRQYPMYTGVACLKANYMQQTKDINIVHFSYKLCMQRPN